MFESRSAGSRVPAVSAARDLRLLARSRAVPPGVAAVALLERVRVEALAEDARLDLVACWEAQESWLLARGHAAVLALAGPAPGTGGGDAAGGAGGDAAGVSVGGGGDVDEADPRHSPAEQALREALAAA